MKFSTRVTGRGKPPPIVEVTHDIVGERFEAPTGWVLFGKVNVRDVDFGAATFEYFASKGSVFERCDFRRISVESGFFSIGPQSVFRDCRFDDADLRHIDPGFARFERCVFDGAKIHGWASDAAEFVDCSFATRISQTRFSGRPWGIAGEGVSPARRINEFRGNDFSKAKLVDIALKNGIDVNAQTWPDGPDYVYLDRFQERLKRAGKVIAAWPDDADRREAQLVLKVYSDDGFREQREFFADRFAIGRSEGVRRAWGVLETVL